MSNISGVSNVNQPSGIPVISGGRLTPDALMLYCASQLNGLDSDIKAQMGRQQQAHDAQQKLGTLKTLMNIPGIALEDSQTKKNIMDAMKKAYDALPPGDPTRAQLQETFRKFVFTASMSDGLNTSGNYTLDNYDAAARDALGSMASNGDHNVVAGEEMTKMCADIDVIMGDLGKGAELQMINLQSMVSQRQMAVQITTQMIAKMNETSMAAVSAIGK